MFFMEEWKQSGLYDIGIHLRLSCKSAYKHNLACSVAIPLHIRPKLANCQNISSSLISCAVKAVAGETFSVLGSWITSPRQRWLSVSARQAQWVRVVVLECLTYLPLEWHLLCSLCQDHEADLLSNLNIPTNMHSQMCTYAKEVLKYWIKCERSLICIEW